MRKIERTNQFKKDFKRYRNDEEVIKRVTKVLDYLIKNEPLPLWYRKHFLSGDYIGCIDIHIKSDILLIYIENPEKVTLLRFGSHSELFGSERKR